MTQRIFSGRRRPLGDISAAPANLTAALQTLQDAPGEILKVEAAHRDALADVERQAGSDVNLSEEGRRAAVATAAQRIVASSTAALDAIAARVTAAATAIDNAAARAVPLPAAGVEAMLARQAAWARARSLLDSGVAADQLVDEATDPEQLAMLREELPTWARIQGAGPDIMARLDAAIAARYAAIATNSADAAAINLDMQADPYEAALQIHLRAAAAVVSSTRVMAADLGSAMLAQAVFQQMQSGLTGGYEDLGDAAAERQQAQNYVDYGGRVPATTSQVQP
jgi:hypothetical protein